MNWELIIWLAVGLVFSEIMYIIFVISFTKKEVKGQWFEIKQMSLFVGVFVVVVNWVILKAFDWEEYHFINLLYFYGGIGLIILFFYLNKKLAFKLKEKKKK